MNASDIASQVDRILNSITFRRSKRLGRFLQFTVQQLLTGNESALKEYLVGVEVFRKQESFDPRVDSIVRVEARRLRAKLERYYLTEGRDDNLIIQFRKGSYVPLVRQRADVPEYNQHPGGGVLTAEVGSFVNLTSESDRECLCTGLTQDLIAALTKLDRLRVSARSGGDQHADYIVQGSFRQQGQRVRVTVQLIKSADQYYVWSETFDRDCSELFLLQDEIADALVSVFNGILSRSV
jgi:serine/threonine-protein kinase